MAPAKSRAMDSPRFMSSGRCIRAHPVRRRVSSEVSRGSAPAGMDPSSGLPSSSSSSAVRRALVNAGNSRRFPSARSTTRAWASGSPRPGVETPELPRSSHRPPPLGCHRAVTSFLSLFPPKVNSGEMFFPFDESEPGAASSVRAKRQMRVRRARVWTRIVRHTLLDHSPAKNPGETQI